MANGTEQEKPFPEVTAYEQWLQTEGIPVIRGLAVEDLNQVPVEPWERKGGLGTYIVLEGAGGTNDAYVCEIPPGGSLKPQKHLYEELIYVLKGRGATSTWLEGGAKQTFEWQAGSLFSPPLNVWHQHYNGGDEPVRYVAVTTAPTVIDLFHDLDFIFNNDFVFKGRYDAASDFFTRNKWHPNRVWETNFIPDVPNLKLLEWKERGAGGTNAMFELVDNTMAAHVSEFPVGTYKKAHKHGPGAQIVLLGGQGYSLMWREGEPWHKIDWHVGSFFVPPDQWFHQHFNTGKEPARYLALRWGSQKHLAGGAFKIDRKSIDKSLKQGGAQIEYQDESPEIGRLFEQECARGGVEEKMKPFTRPG